MAQFLRNGEGSPVVFLGLGQFATRLGNEPEIAEGNGGGLPVSGLAEGPHPLIGFFRRR